MRILVDIKPIVDGFSVEVGEMTAVGKIVYNKFFKCYYGVSSIAPLNRMEFGDTVIQQSTVSAHVEIVDTIEEAMLALDAQYCQPKRGDDGYFHLRLREADVAYIPRIEICVTGKGFAGNPDQEVLDLVSVVGMIAPMLSVKWED